MSPIEASYAVRDLAVLNKPVTADKEYSVTIGRKTFYRYADVQKYIQTQQEKSK